jgi:hypothetical protein
MVVTMTKKVVGAIRGSVTIEKLLPKVCAIYIRCLVSSTRGHPATAARNSTVFKKPMDAMWRAAPPRNRFWLGLVKPADFRVAMLEPNRMLINWVISAKQLLL